VKDFFQHCKFAGALFTPPPSLQFIQTYKGIIEQLKIYLIIKERIQIIGLIRN